MVRRPRSIREQLHNRRPRGQSLVEFALILPVMLTMFGAAVDFARVYGAWVTLEGATRDAAEQVASDTTITTRDAALTAARRIICTETQGLAGFTAPAGNPAACTSPSVDGTSFAWSSNATAPGGTVRSPIVTTTLTASFPFRTLFGYPLLTRAGAWTLTSTQSYAIAQGRQ
jgi:Flp pilus assembly protein TadG